MLPKEKKYPLKLIIMCLVSILFYQINAISILVTVSPSGIDFNFNFNNNNYSLLGFSVTIYNNNH